MTEQLQSSLAFLREHLVRTETAIDALQAVASHGQMIEAGPINLVEVTPPPARIAGPKGKRTKTAEASTGDEPLGKRERRRAEIRTLHAAGKTTPQMAKALKVTPQAISQQLKKLGLTPHQAEAPPAAPASNGSAAGGAGEPIDGGGLVKFLKEIGARCVQIDTNSFQLEGKAADTVALLEAANAWRRRHALPLFTLKR